MICFPKEVKEDEGMASVKAPVARADDALRRCGRSTNAIFISFPVFQKSSCTYRLVNDNVIEQLLSIFSSPKCCIQSDLGVPDSN